jgi:ribonuclease T2
MARVVFACILLLAAVLPTFSQRPASPGSFDYYLLVLSWSPEYCYSHRGAPECDWHRGFIVHGLWPQYRDGSWPAHCSETPGLSDSSALDGIMPAELMTHEWQTHGTCSGLSPSAYFGLIRKLFHLVTIPPDLAHPRFSKTIHPALLKGDFERANSGLTDQSIVVQCRRDYLTAVQICLDKQGARIISCPTQSEDCSSGTIKVSPVR